MGSSECINGGAIKGLLRLRIYQVVDRGNSFSKDLLFALFLFGHDQLKNVYLASGAADVCYF